MAEDRNLVATAATELVNRISNEIEYIFRHRYTDFGGGKREQTNPYVTLSDTEQTEVIIESMTMVLGQIAAMAFASGEKIDQQTVYAQLSKRIRAHGDAYHQQFLHLKYDQQFLHLKETQKREEAKRKEPEGG